jgi:hypothetical protein
MEIVDADLELTRSAAELRAEHKLPYSDCLPRPSPSIAKPPSLPATKTSSMLKKG